jgi:hypothetical protein
MWRGFYSQRRNYVIEIDSTQGASAIGMDIGTSRIVAAVPDGSGIKVQSQLNAFVAIPYSKLTEKALKQEQVPHTVSGGEILVHGTASERFADLMNADTRRPMLRGFLNADEREGVRVITEIARMLAGPSAQKAQKVCFSVPAPPLGGEDNLTYHEAALKHLFGEMGYEATSVTEGLAVVYSELADTNYTGIGVSLGGGLCNVCFAYLSTPMMAFSIPKAGDFIDASAAAVISERSNRVRILKEESFYLNGHTPAEKLHQVLTVYYDDMIRSLVAALNDAFARTRNVPRLGKPVPLVLSGGTALPKGFRERFEKALRASDFPLPLSEVRMAGEPLNATARGALIAALSD